MSVFTEARIRKLYRQSVIADNGVFELDRDEKLTPAARGFLNDHHIQVVSSNSTKRKASAVDGGPNKEPITRLEDSAVYPLLFRLTKLYTYFLRNQRELHLAFLDEKCEQMGILLRLLENMVGHNIQDDFSDYHPSLMNHAELQAIRVSRQLDQEQVLLTYEAPVWQLTCYESYLETVLLRKEFEQLTDGKTDPFAQKVSQLLKSLEVQLWLISQ